MFIKHIIFILTTTVLFGQFGTDKYGWDNRDFYIPGTLNTESIVVTYNFGADTLRVLSGGAAYWRTFFSTIFQTEVSGQWSITTGDNLVFDVGDGVGEHFYIVLGDAAGSTNFLIEDSGSNIVFNIDSDGDVDAGQWKATAIDFSDYTNTTAGTGIAFTDDEISTDDSAIDHDQLSNYEGDEHFTQANITTVGTIGTGTWQGTPIADAYIPNDLTLITTGEIRTNSNFDVNGFNGASSGGWIPVYNDGTSGQLSAISISGGIIINYTTVP